MSRAPFAPSVPAIASAGAPLQAARGDTIFCAGLFFLAV